MGKKNSIDAEIKMNRINESPIVSIINDSKNKILFILHSGKMKNVENIFYNKISNFKEEEKKVILVEMEKIIKDPSKIDTFISNIRVIFAEKKGYFSNESLEIINYLKYLVLKDMKRLQKIYINIKNQ